MAATRKKDQKILAMVMSGAPIDAIAKALDLASAKQVVNATIRELAKAPNLDSVSERKLAIRRIQELQARFYTEARKGDIKAADLVLRLDEVYRRLNTENDQEGELTEAFRKTVEASSELDLERDAALIKAGEQISKRIDHALTTGTQIEGTKALYLIPHLNNILQQMNATPAARSAAQTGQVPEQSKIAKLKAHHAKLRVVGGNG